MAIDYFTEAELRALPQMSSTSTYTTARIEASAAYITAIIEREVGTSFVARTVTGEVHDGGEYAIALRRPYVRSVTSATEDGTAVTDTLRVSSGVVRKFASGTYTPIYWAAGTGNVAVTYQSGYASTPPADIKEAALKATRAHLLASNSNAGVSDRQTSISTDQGTISFVVASKERPTGYPDVDAVILGWKARLDNFGFA